MIRLNDTPKPVRRSTIGHEGEAIIPSGNDVISRGDTVMVVTAQTGFGDIGDIPE